MQALFDKFENDMLTIYDNLISLGRDEFLERIKEEAAIDADRGVNIFSQVYKQNKARSILGMKPSQEQKTETVGEPELPENFITILKQSDIGCINVFYINRSLIKTLASRLSYYGKKLNCKFSYESTELINGQMRVIVKRIT
jgi:hypothetical protein